MRADLSLVWFAGATPDKLFCANCFRIVLAGGGKVILLKPQYWRKPKPYYWQDLPLQSEECQKPQPPLLLKKVSQYTSHLYCNTPPICTAVLLVPLRSEEREILSVLLPFVSQYTSHLYRNTPPICIAVLLRKSWWLWSPECSPFNVRARKGRDDWATGAHALLAP